MRQGIQTLCFQSAVLLQVNTELFPLVLQLDQMLELKINILQVYVFVSVFPPLAGLLTLAYPTALELWNSWVKLFPQPQLLVGSVLCSVGVPGVCCSTAVL